jgi:aminopeptidase N
LWPDFCGNLFPCNPAPHEGLTFTLALENVPAGQTAIYPNWIPIDSPPYMIAFAIGDYTQVELGTTTNGTHLSVWYLPGEEAAALRGTARLVEVFDFFEQTYGDYAFGGEAGSVSANWGPGGFGGMEHHPFWHVGSGSMGSSLTHFHEAAHGWYGNGVRIRCWEDFVLSEGLADYLSARAYEAVNGPAGGTAVWNFYQRQLAALVANGFDTIAWPDGCDITDFLTHPLWSGIPYKKGALFLRAVEQRVGRDALDVALASFYECHVGEAAGMGDLIAHIEDQTGADLTDLVDGWLRSLGIPAI